MSTYTRFWLCIHILCRHIRCFALCIYILYRHIRGFALFIYIIYRHIQVFVLCIYILCWHIPGFALCIHILCRHIRGFTLCIHILWRHIRGFALCIYVLFRHTQCFALCIYIRVLCRHIRDFVFWPLFNSGTDDTVHGYGTLCNMTHFLLFGEIIERECLSFQVMAWLHIVFCCWLLAVTSQARYQPTWDSLDARPLPTWYDEAKIGIFISWGVYSVPSFGNEWFWNKWRTGQPDIVKYMKDNFPPGFTYADFAAQFTAEFYDPDAWAEIIKASGAK